MFCRNCGKPSEEALCPECAAAEQAPVTQTDVAAETIPEEMPDTAPAEEYLVMNLGEDPNATEDVPAKKKKSKTALWIVLGTLAVVGILVGIFFDTIKGWLHYQTSDPETWYQEVEVESSKAATSSIAKLYGMLIKGTGLPMSDYNTTDTTVNLQINETLLDAAIALIPESELDNLPVDLDKLQNLSVSTKFTATEDMLHLVASLSGELDLHVYVDMPNSKIYLQLPQAQEQALVIDAKTMFNMDLSAGLEGLINSAKDSLDQNTNGAVQLISNALQNQKFKDAMPSEEEFQGMLDRFAAAAITELSKNAQKDRRTVEVGNGSETQNVLTTVVDEATIRQALKAVLNTAKDDPTVKKILDAVSAYMAENGTEMDLYSVVSMAIPSLTAELDQPIKNFGTITLETYLDSDDEVVGRSVQISNSGETMRLSFNVVDGEYFQLTMPEMTINGTIDEQDEETTISFDLPVDANNIFKVMIKYSDTKYSIRVTPPADLVKLAVDVDDVPDMLLNELALEIGVESVGSNKANLWVSVLAGDTRMVTATLSETLSKETPTLPSSATNVSNTRDAANWVLTIDRPALVQALTNLGLKEAFADELISQLVYEAVYQLS